MSTTGDIQILDIDLSRKLQKQISEACDSLDTCIATFDAQPVPPNGTPPAVSAMVVTMLTQLYGMCVEHFRKSQEKMTRLSDDIDNAITQYEQMDEANAQGVDESVSGEVDRVGGGDSGSSTDGGGSGSDSSTDRDSSSDRDRSSDSDRDSNSDSDRDSNSDNAPVTLLTANHAANMSGEVDGVFDDLEDMDIDRDAIDGALLVADDPANAYDPEAKRDELLDQGELLKQLLDGDNLASGGLTDAQVNVVTNGTDDEVQKLGIGLKYSAAGYEGAVNHFYDKHDGYADKFAAEDRAHSSSDSDSRSTSSGDD